MKLIVGLGNPGTQYAKTRHNAGFMVVDRLLAAHAGNQPLKARFNAATAEASFGGERVMLAKPTTFMNRSGQSVSDAVRFFKLDPAADLLVITDDIYLPTGATRMRPSGGSGGHNGLASITSLLGHDDYPRLRIGVGLLPSGGKPAFMDQADFVLGRFTGDEEPLLADSLSRAVQAVETFVAKGINHAMNTCNAGPARPKPEPRPGATPGPGAPPPPTIPAPGAAPADPA
jgi:PTH1 family peptidyl-tRNA hydrolase